MPYPREVNEMPKCASCGILVPCCEVVREHEGQKRVFCSEKCARIYVTYWYPKYGQPERAPSRT